MFNLKSDAEGFLVGELIKDFDKMEGDIHAIAMDIAAIRSFLAGGGLPDAFIPSIGAESYQKAESKTNTITPSRVEIGRESGKMPLPLAKQVATPSRSRRDIVIDIKVESSQFIDHAEAEEGNAGNRGTEARGVEKSGISAKLESESGSPFPHANSTAIPGHGGAVIAVKGRVVEGKADDAAKSKPERDEKGRFAANTKANGAEPDSRSLAPGNGALSGVTERLKDAIVEGFADSERVDPTIQAVQEVVTPLNRGFGIIFGDGAERKKERWYKRIWKTLKRKEIVDSKADVITHKRLRAIEEKPISEGGHGWLAFLLPVLLGIAKAIFGLPLSLAGAIAGALARFLPGFLARRLPGLGIPGRNGRGGGAGVPVPGRDGRRKTQNNPRKRSGLGRIFDWGKERFGRGAEWGGEVARKGGGILGGIGRRIGRVRGLGAIGGLLALAGVADTEMDDTLTREEKNREHGATAGRAATGIGGAAIGAAVGSLLGPVGTIVGGMIGGYAADYFAGDASADVGEKVADWVTQLNISDIPGDIKNTVSGWVNDLKQSEIGQYIKTEWDKVSSSLVQMWNNAVVGFSAAWDGLKSWVDKNVTAPIGDWLKSVNEKLKGWTGVDVGQTAKDAAKAVSNAASSAWESTKDITKKAVSAASGAASSAWEATKDAASQVMTGRKSSVNERWQKAKGDIVDAAKTAGVDAGTLANIAHFESMGFDPEAKAKTTTAHGYGQFLDGTWADMISKYGAKYGISGTEKMHKSKGKWTSDSIEFANKYRHDTKIQASMLAEFTKENVERGKALGGSDDVANVYALHNLGSSGGEKFLKALHDNPNAPVSSVLSSKVINNNPGLYSGGNITLSQAYERMSKMMHAGDSYAQEARNLQNGIDAPVTGGLSEMASNAYESIKTSAAVMFGQDEKIPPELLNTRVKASDGTTKTLSDLGVSTYGELKKKGGQAFAGGDNDAATLYATSLIQQGMGDNFDRITAQNDLYHAKNSPSSSHTKGNKTDFTVKGMSGADADRRTAEILENYGLQRGIDFNTINEYDKPSAKATGGHIDFKLNESGRAKIAKVMSEGIQPGTAPATPNPVIAGNDPLKGRPEARAFELMSRPDKEKSLNGDDYALAAKAVMWTVQNAPESEKAGIIDKYGVFLSQEEINSFAAPQPKKDVAQKASVPAASAAYYDYGQRPLDVSSKIAPPPAPVIAKSATIPPAPAMPTMPKAPDAPAEFSPISSGRSANQSPVNITLPEFLVGQDVRDRRIAHIATGGISG